MPPARQPGSGTRGYIIPIGGAEDKIRNREILEQFIDLCGGGSEVSRWDGTTNVIVSKVESITMPDDMPEAHNYH